MSRTTNILTVLLQTDYPEIVLARDVVGTDYLCSFVSREEEGDRFVAVAISASRLGSFRAGKIDLRDVLLEPEDGERWTGIFRRIEGLPCVVLDRADDVPLTWIPEPGFLLSDFLGEVDEDAILQDALQRQAAVVVYELQPPPSRGGVGRIDADLLADAITSFQAVVRHSYRNLRAALPLSRRAEIEADGATLQTFAFSTGSFRVHFESKRGTDLFGASQLHAAMRKVDELVGLVNEPPEVAIEGLRQHKGHLLSSLRRLLKLVAEEQAPIVYRWADPSMTSVSGTSISTPAAEALGALLDSRKELTTEEVEFSGVFIRIELDRATWTMLDDEGVTRRGELHESAENLLAAASVEPKRYAVACDERLEETGAGKIVPKLYMRSLRAL